jgi:hypothetical protein
MGIFATLLYMLLAKQMTVFAINRPSLSNYEKLITLHSSSSMDCPCSHIAIEYRSFVTTEASLHQVKRLNSFNIRISLTYSSE